MDSRELEDANEQDPVFLPIDEYLARPIRPIYILGSTWGLKDLSYSPGTSEKKVKPIIRFFKGLFNRKS